MHTPSAVRANDTTSMTSRPNAKDAKRQTDTHRRRQQEEHQPLTRGKECSAEDLAENDGLPRHRSDQHALKESFPAVFDDRDR